MAAHFLTTYAEENGFLPKKLVADAREMLLRYDWPGNIRELKNLVERLSIMVSGDAIYARICPR